MFYVGLDYCLFRLDSLTGPGYIVEQRQLLFFFSFSLCRMTQCCFIHYNALQDELLLNHEFPWDMIFYLCISVSNVHKSCVSSFATVIWRLLFSSLCSQLKMLRLRALVYSPASGCHIISWLSVFLPAFVCVLRKWEVLLASNCLFASFLLYLIQLLLDEYLWPLHLRGLQQSGAEAHPPAPHSGEPPKHLHFCK